jgi:subtilisin family serine protease/subtilase family serine protease
MRLRAIVVAILVVAALSDRSSTQTIDTRQFVAGEVLVKFRPGSNPRSRADVHRAVDAAPQAAISRTGVERVRVRPGDEAAAITRYRRNPNVLYAELNYVRRIPEASSQLSDDAIAPGDTHFDQQWGLNNTGQEFYCIPWISGELCLFSGVPDADIDAPEAWAISTGYAAITVAVLDSGVDYTHPDLAPNYAGGADFVFFDGDPMDDHGHGTHVAGTIAAALDNLTGSPSAEEGVAGVAPNARIKAYKVCRSDGSCDDFAIQQAIARAIVDGADIINMSLGQPAYSQSLDEAVQDAWNAGLVIVAGAGNDGVNSPFYPAAFQNVISVAAFDAAHERPDFSNFGSWVDLSAPGDLILSTYPMATCAASTVPGDAGCYEWSSGTSMATPHVSGAAALVWSRTDVTSNQQVVDILLGSADRQGASNVRLDSWTFHGGLNLRDALTYSTTRPVARAGADQTVTDANGNGAEVVVLDGSGSSDPDGTIVSYSWREGGTQIATGVTASVSLAAGVHTITLEVTDDDGNTASDTVVVTVATSNQVTVSASTPLANESGPVNGGFTVTRTGDTSDPMTVRFSLGGTAAAGADYQAVGDSVVIAAGSATAKIPVTVIDDPTFEVDETVVLTLTADAAYGIGSPGSATVTLISDDQPADLVVVTVTTPASAGADQDMVVSDTTRNQGTGSSPASSTAFYLSADTTLDAADVLLGSRPVPPLAAGASDIASVTLRVPASTPTDSYFVLAQADWGNATDESVETNNLRASRAIKIGPDLVILAITAPATAAAGGAITVSDTAKNQGDGNAGSSTTKFYLSINSSLDAADVVLGTRSVGALAAGASDASSTTLTLPAATATGAYFVIAQADSAGVLVETSETNNYKASLTVKVGPDLAVTALSGPAAADAGSTITVTDTTRNQGAGAAPASSTGFYLSDDTGYDVTDTYLGSRAVGQLAADGSSSGSTPLQIPATTGPGNYYVIARADWNSGVPETSESNNNRTSGVIKIGGDLILSTLSAPSTAMANGSITVTDATRNQGAAPVPQSATGFYLSPDSGFDTTDVFLGSRVVAALAPAATDTASTALVIPQGTVPGSYYVIGVADFNGAIAEITESNNTRSALVRIGPDLTVTALTAPASAVAGTSITAGDTTKNQGGETSPASVTRFYLSVNSALDAGDVLLGSRAVPSLAPGASHAGSASVVIPAGTAAGSYYVIAKSDGNDALAESLENNNTRTKAISIAAAP